MLSLLWALFQTHYFEIWLSLFSYIANISESFNEDKISTTIFERSVKINQRSYSVSVERVSSQPRKPAYKASTQERVLEDRKYKPRNGAL